MLSARVEALRALAVTAKTAIYNEDAMTAIELAGATACKVNQCVECINEIINVLDNIKVGETGAMYYEETETIEL